MSGGVSLTALRYYFRIIYKKIERYLHFWEIFALVQLGSKKQESYFTLSVRELPDNIWFVLDSRLP